MPVQQLKGDYVRDERLQAREITDLLGILDGARAYRPSCGVVLDRDPLMQSLKDRLHEPRILRMGKRFQRRLP
ncbi:hypothetical protein [Ktedonobacter racemifer]|uniref:Uncharacterized protein n=1 Tax=Ktedonobacter racemifer DSM 44963 TaxID=485913 RepID=D6TT88_KTERA|nr:hypothetical protein [Ktedonobacter racemifer]EFH83639.1 hypothetical protein Krac_4631 [Ktedonobacter racemifer DSM 44963]